MYCLAFVGLREGEILGLCFEDFDQDNHTINIRHAVQYLMGKGLTITEPKTEKSKRSIPLPDFVYDALVKYCDSHSVSSGFKSLVGHKIRPASGQVFCLGSGTS